MMRVMTMFGMVIFLTTPLGCLHLGRFHESRTPEWVAQHTKIEHDNFKKITTVTGPKLRNLMPGGFSAGAHEARIRAWTYSNRRAPDQYQIYVATDHYGRLHYYDSTFDDSGLQFDTIEIGSSNTDCSQRRSSGEARCRYEEKVGVTVSRAYLDSKRTSGIHMKVSGSGGEFILKIPGSWLTGFLRQFDSTRTASRNSTTLSSTPRPRQTVANESASWFKIASDRKANYRIESKRMDGRGHLIVVSERRGSSGASWSEREIDCKTGRVRYTREGDTLEGLRAYDVPAGMRTPIWESITGQVVLRLCPSLRRRASR